MRPAVRAAQERDERRRAVPSPSAAGPPPPPGQMKPAPKPPSRIPTIGQGPRLPSAPLLSSARSAPPRPPPGYAGGIFDTSGGRHALAVLHARQLSPPRASDMAGLLSGSEGTGLAALTIPRGGGGGGGAGHGPAPPVPPRDTLPVVMVGPPAVPQRGGGGGGGLLDAIRAGTDLRSTMMVQPARPLPPVPPLAGVADDFRSRLAARRSAVKDDSSNDWD
jgi:hypothetical protein